MDRSIFDDIVVPPAPCGNRRAWRRAAVAAVGLHLSLFVSLFVASVGGMQDAGGVVIEPLVEGALSREAIVESTIAADPSGVEFSVQTAVYEPGDSVIRDAVAGLTAAGDRTAGDEAWAKLARKARVLEEISSPSEVSRMAGKITAILGVEKSPGATTRPAAGAFDFDRSVMTRSTREVEGDAVRIRETLTDAAGRSFIMIASRRVDPATGEYVYETSNIENGITLTFPATVATFEEAEARHRPFELMERFPLVGQLHREAVLPILRMLAEPEGGEEERGSPRRGGSD